LPPSVEFELFEGLKDVPPYDEDDDGDLAPFGVRRLREAIAAADAVLIATPNTTTRSRASSRTHWTGRHARLPTTFFATSRWR
jgi:chromate reductase